MLESSFRKRQVCAAHRSSPRVQPGWQSKLSRPISSKTGTKLETLADARAFILDMLPESDQDRSSWQHATELLIEAAERGGATTEQIERALFLQGMWIPK